MSTKRRGKRPARQRKAKASSRGKRLPPFFWLALGGIALILLGLAGFWHMRTRAGQQRSVEATEQTAQAVAATLTAVAPTPEPTLPPNLGPPTGCIRRPAFVSQLDLGNRIYIGTNLKGYQGLTLSAQRANGEMVVFQHPTWDDAGNLAAYVLDRDGNVYVAPAPFVSLEDNPPQEQNNIYKVDTNTGVMSLFMTLPWARPPDTVNPYGVMGLAYDCDTHSLYASSVAGSTYDEELGRIFQIDLASAAVVSQLDKVDAFGLGVYQGVSGKRLYFGSARNSSIRSVALDEKGALDTEQRLEFYLLQAPGGKDERAKKIQFPQKDEMLIKAIEFNYTLRAASDFVEHDYTYRYDLANDAWRFEEMHRREDLF